MVFFNIFKRKESFRDTLALDLPPEPPELPELQGLDELPSLDDMPPAGQFGQSDADVSLPEFPDNEKAAPTFEPLNYDDGFKEPAELGLPSFSKETDIRDVEHLKNFEPDPESSFEALPELPELPDIPSLPQYSTYQQPAGLSLPLLPSPKTGYYLGLSEFKRMLGHLHEARGDIRDVHTFVNEVGNSIHEEQKLFSSWKSSLEDIQRRLHSIDKGIFKA